MQQLTEAIVHNKGSIVGTAMAFTLGFIGNAGLSATALVMGILSGAATFCYTIWKWRQDYLKTHKHKK